MIYAVAVLAALTAWLILVTASLARSNRDHERRIEGLETEKSERELLKPPDPSVLVLRPGSPLHNLQESYTKAIRDIASSLGIEEAQGPEVPRDT